MKYVVMEDRIGLEYIFLFPDLLNHQDMANSLGSKSIKAVSAGFIGNSANGLYCHGKSLTLNLKCRKDKDDRLLKNALKEY